MSGMGQVQTLTTIAMTSALPLQADKLGGERTSRFTMSDYGVTADGIRDLTELRLIAKPGHTATPVGGPKSYKIGLYGKPP